MRLDQITPHITTYEIRQAGNSRPWAPMSGPPWARPWGTESGSPWGPADQTRM
jgi:hypothetical protein